MPNPLYDYGPPVDVGLDPEDIGTPQDNSDAVDVVEDGDSPLAPPPDAANNAPPGGSPSDEMQQLYDPSIGSLSPTTAVVGADATVTVTGTNFTDNSTVEVDQVPATTVYVSDTELTATLPDPGTAGTAAVTVRNPTAEMESNTVDFTWT